MRAPRYCDLPDEVVDPGQGGQGAKGKVPDRHAGEEQHRAGEDGHAGHGAEVLADQDQPAQQADHRSGDDQRGQPVKLLAVALQIPRQEEDHGGLGELGRLQRQESQPQEPPRAGTGSENGSEH